MHIDHVVLWVKDAKRSLEFYSTLLGFTAEREEEFFAGKTKFPSVRINEHTILDIMERKTLLHTIQNVTESGEKVGGAPINHICISMSQEEYDATVLKLVSKGVKLSPEGENSFGAQGRAIKSVYFNDPDGNVLEIRCY